MSWYSAMWRDQEFLQEIYSTPLQRDWRPKEARSDYFRSTCLLLFFRYVYTMLKGVIYLHFYTYVAKVKKVLIIFLWGFLDLCV
jgi:hypothetical protein